MRESWGHLEDMHARWDVPLAPSLLFISRPGWGQLSHPPLAQGPLGPPPSLIIDWELPGSPLALSAATWSRRVPFPDFQ